MRTRLAGLTPTTILLAGAIYMLFPIAWILFAATKSVGELFTTPTFSIGSALTSNIVALSGYQDGAYWIWTLNSIIYAAGGAFGSTIVSAMAGYALARFSFRGEKIVMISLLGGIMVPAVVLAIPQYLVMSSLGLSNTYWSILLPSFISPFGIYLCMVFARSAIPDELIEAGRIDGAGETRLFRSVSVPLMLPGLVTVFMLQFVAIWNNFLLPFIMLSDESKYPLTTGLYLLLERGSGSPALYSLAITGALLAIIPLCALMLALQRYWRADLLSGSVKG